MAHDEDRRWRERMRRDDDNRRYSHNDPRGEYRGEGSGRGWSEGSARRNRDRPDEFSSGSGSYGSGGYGGREGRWGERSGSGWEQSGWRDMDEGRHQGGRHEMSQRDMGGSMGGSTGGPMGSSWRRDNRQDRDYAGSMRAGEYGSMGGERSSGYGGSRYGTGSYGGRSGMGYGGGSYGSPPSSGWGAREYDQYSGMGESAYGSGRGRDSSEQGYGYGGPHDWGGERGRGGEERGFWDKASDEVSSWFGDEEAERRREMDRRHSGLGPRNYARSDSRINEDVCDRLTDNPMVDASDIEVSVSGREVTLSGAVRSRDEKRRAEDIAEAVSGVTHVQNNLRVQQQAGSSVQRTLDLFSHATEGAFGEQGGSTMSSRTTSSTGASGGGATGSGSMSGAPGRTGSAGSSTSGSAETKTTGTSPGVMRSDPSTSTTRGA